MAAEEYGPAVRRQGVIATSFQNAGKILGAHVAKQSKSKAKQVSEPIISIPPTVSPKTLKIHKNKTLQTVCKGWCHHLV